jgi:hypothetical protein
MSNVDSTVEIMLRQTMGWIQIFLQPVSKLYHIPGDREFLDAIFLPLKPARGRCALAEILH